MILRLMLLLSSCLLLTACLEETVISPKPRGFPRVLYPERGYQEFEQSYCSFTFEYPVYAEIQRDTIYFEEESTNDCWFDVYMPFCQCMNYSNSFQLYIIS